MQAVEARVVDSVHLELKQPLHLRRGRRVTVRVEPLGPHGGTTGTRAAALQAIRRLFAAAPRRRSLADELIAERRREAQRG